MHWVNVTRLVRNWRYRYRQLVLFWHFWWFVQWKCLGAIMNNSWRDVALWCWHYILLLVCPTPASLHDNIKRSYWHVGILILLSTQDGIQYQGFILSFSWGEGVWGGEVEVMLLPLNNIISVFQYWWTGTPHILLINTTIFIAPPTSSCPLDLVSLNLFLR